MWNMSIYCHKQGYIYIHTHTYMSVVVISWCITNSFNFIYFICLVLLSNWRKEYLFLKCSLKEFPIV